MFMKFLNRRHFTTKSKWKCVSIMKKGSDGGMTMDIYVWLCGCRERELDYTTKCSCYPCQTPDQCRRRIRSNQEEVFIKLLLVGKTKSLPAIIHCRDTGDGAVAARALELITQLGCRDMRFHRHCFNGDLLELQQWKTLPNIVFGVTWKSVRENPDVIPRINLTSSWLDRILRLH
jgi:hypothetical protein